MDRHKERNETMLQSTPFGQTCSNQALHLFRETTLQGWFRRLWARLLHRSSRLLDLDETLCCVEVKSSHYTGTHAVCIDCIKGTQGKADTFDAEFHPVKESSRSRWLSVALEKLRGHDLPPVELIDVEGIYYVRDGHHRISVARSLGQAYIDAEITTINLARRIM
jgi:hypothetical protein